MLDFTRAVRDQIDAEAWYLVRYWRDWDRPEQLRARLEALCLERELLTIGPELR
jgi:hypothetical protein